MFKDYNTDWVAIYMPFYVQYQYAIFSIEKLNVLFLNRKKRLTSYCVFSVIYTASHFFTYFMNVIMLNDCGRT